LALNYQQRVHRMAVHEAQCVLIHQERIDRAQAQNEQQSSRLVSLSKPTQPRRPPRMQNTSRQRAQDFFSFPDPTPPPGLPNSRCHSPPIALPSEAVCSPERGFAVDRTGGSSIELPSASRAERDQEGGLGLAWRPSRLVISTHTSPAPLSFGGGGVNTPTGNESQSQNISQATTSPAPSTPMSDVSSNSFFNEIVEEPPGLHNTHPDLAEGQDPASGLDNHYCFFNDIPWETALARQHPYYDPHQVSHSVSGPW
jgi:hypothetical protein